jgi:hypothetical protein
MRDAVHRSGGDRTRDPTVRDSTTSDDCRAGRLRGRSAVAHNAGHQPFAQMQEQVIDGGPFHHRDTLPDNEQLQGVAIFGVMSAPGRDFGAGRRTRVHPGRVPGPER